MPYNVDISHRLNTDREGYLKIPPFHSTRHEVVKTVEPLLKMGDLIFRRGNESWAGIPFSKLVARVTKSKWSHASIVAPGIEMVEVNANGTMKERLIDHLDRCDSGEFAVYRFVGMDEDMRLNLAGAITRFLELDPDYDFTFDDPSKFYCTEGVAWICDRAGLHLCDPMTMKELIPARSYAIIVPINWFVRAFAGKGIPLDVPLYIVGNENQGMLSNPLLRNVCTVTAAEQAA